MSTAETHKFGALGICFELVSDWKELTEHWRKYTAYFESNEEPQSRYIVLSRESLPVFKRTGKNPLFLQRAIDFYPLLEDAFLKDLVSKLSERYPIYHAAAVAKQGRATIYLGEPNTGKSTLCVEKVREGHTYLSDEMALVDGNDVVALPRPISFNDLENPTGVMPIGDERFEILGYAFEDKKSAMRSSFQFLPKKEFSAMAGDRFPVENVVLLEAVENGAPTQRVLEGAEKRARLALSQFPG